MWNPCPGDETVPKHMFSSKNWYLINLELKKIISCFWLILEYFKTLKYANFYEILFLFAKKLTSSDHVQGTLKMENVNKSLENFKNKPAFCHFYFLRRVGQIYLLNIFTKSYVQEKFYFYSGSTILKRMSRLLSKNQFLMGKKVLAPRIEKWGESYIIIK